METNFIFVCMLPNYMNEVASLVASKLDMFTVSVEELMQQDLGDETALESLLKDKDGKVKIEQSEKRVAKKITNFENSIVCLSLNSMMDEKNVEMILQAGCVVYLQISPMFFERRCKFSGDFVESDLNAITFSEQDKHWVEQSELVLNCSRYKQAKAAKKLIKICTKYLKNQKES
jgi:shikimate kinase